LLLPVPVPVAGVNHSLLLSFIHTKRNHTIAACCYLQSKKRNVNNIANYYF